MSCPGCLTHHLMYEICFQGETNKKMIPILLHHIYLLNGQATLTGNILLLREDFVMDLLDFCTEHMNVDLISYRIEGNEWAPLATITSVINSQWIDDLIANERIISYFQPIVDQEEKIFGHEILARSVRENGTLISPHDIFTSARRRNRLFALDKLCRITAVKQSAKLSNQKVFINFLPTSIYSPEHCLKTTLEMSNKMGVDPSHFVFEVVETEKVEDIDHLKTILRYYKSHGFEYALDDVGEGYSTVDLLKELQPTYMKLDMKYVRGISACPSKQQMANKMLQVATEIGSIPLAEGIEEKRDFEYLKGLGYKLFQGYLFGKPAPAPLPFGELLH